MKRVMLDTNIYGRIVEEQTHPIILSKEANVKVYGSVVIRKELRNAPKRIKIVHEGVQRKIRIVLLSLYDSIVHERTLPVTQQTDDLAEQYFVAYKKFGGSEGYTSIFNDFILVATATLNTLDIVYSNDKRTMLSEQAITAYSLINEIHGLQTPHFQSYPELIRELERKNPW
ncbi:type II toxin-antitoxin system VapC family toxin [Candidatus Woesearchaeota archaeon]|nr:type II toxin-antitoxin system VapC family toxin [Candidatus Woesearchaeota archaeon]